MNDAKSQLPDLRLDNERIHYVISLTLSWVNTLINLSPDRVLTTSESESTTPTSESTTSSL
jgi:hypothetical protein